MAENLDSWASTVEDKVNSAMAILENAARGYFTLNQVDTPDKPIFNDVIDFSANLSVDVPEAYTNEPIEFRETKEFEKNIDLPAIIENLDNNFEVSASTEGLFPYQVTRPNTQQISDAIEDYQGNATTDGFSPYDPNTLQYDKPENELKDFQLNADVTAFDKRSYDDKMNDPDVLAYLDDYAVLANTIGLDLNAPPSDSIETEIPKLGELENITFDDNVEDKRHTTIVWSSQSATSLLDQIKSVMANGGFGISADMQTAIFNTDIERKKQTLDDALLRVNANFGARGFRVPSHLLTGPRNEIIQKFQFDLENQSREIVKLMEEHYRQNVIAALSNGIQLETMLSEFTNKYDQLYIALMELAVKKYTALIQAEISKFDAKVKRMEAEISRMRIRLEIYKTQVEWKRLALDKVRIDLAIDELQIKLLEFKVDTRLKNRELDVKVLDAHTEMINKFTAYYSKLDELRMQVKSTSTDSAIKVANQQISMGKFYLDSKAQELEKIKMDINIDDLELRGIQMKIDGFTKKVEADIAVERLGIDAKQAEIEKIKADIAVDEIKLKELTSLLESYVAANAGDIEAQKAEIQAVVAHNQVLRDERMLDIEVKRANISILQADIEQMKAKIEKNSQVAKAWIDRYATNVKKDGDYLSAYVSTYGSELSRDGNIYNALGQLAGNLAVGVSDSVARLISSESV